MYFSESKPANGDKFVKIAIVAALHVVLATALIKSMNAKTFEIPKIAETILMLTPEVTPPPPPPEPPKPMQKVAPPEAVVPPVEVAVPPPQTVEPQIAATTEPAPSVTPEPGTVQGDAPPSEPSSNTGAMRTAVLADASGCGTPEYPARAARNGESGTVTLALLVGTDGSVTGSRVQKSSGSRDLDRAAVAGLSLCKFKPATKNGVAEEAWAQIAYVWTLQG